MRRPLKVTDWRKYRDLLTTTLLVVGLLLVFSGRGALSIGGSVGGHIAAVLWRYGGIAVALAIGVQAERIPGLRWLWTFTAWGGIGSFAYAEALRRAGTPVPWVGFAVWVVAEALLVRPKLLADIPSGKRLWPMLSGTVSWLAANAAGALLGWWLVTAFVSRR